MVRLSTPDSPSAAGAGTESSLSYIPPLDGLRAFAVLGVMAYHSGIQWLPAGFLGVDSFFVLSGFLITSLLVSEWQRMRTIRFAPFWARRARRLLPALLLLLVFVVLYAEFGTPAGTYPGLRLDALSTLFYVANWHFVLIGSNYFTQAGLPSLLTHTWSLAVEEQFYLVWPLVVLGILKVTGRLWVLLAASVVGVLASAIEMALLFHHGVGTTRLYYGTDTQGQCLLVGAALASGLALFAQRRRDGSGLTHVGNAAWAARSGWARSSLGIVGVASAAGTGVLWWRASYTGTFLWEGGFLVASLATAAVLICVVCVQRSWLALALSISPLRYLGRISYGLYLWHYPLFQWVAGPRTGLTGYPLFGLRCAVTLVVATASFYLVERPIRQGDFLRQWRARVATPLAVGLVAVVVVVTTGTGIVAAVAPPTSGPLSGVPLTGGRLTGGPPPPPPHGSVKRVLMLGDSTNLTLGIGLSFTAAHYGAAVINEGILGCGVAFVSEITVNGQDQGAAPACNPSTPPTEQWPALWAGWVHTYRPAIVTILAGRWEVSTVEWQGHWTSILAPAFASYIRRQLQRAVDVASSGGAPVVLFTAPCFDSGTQFDGAPWPEDQQDRLDAYNGIVREVAAANPTRATVVDLDALFCPGGGFRTEIDGVIVRAPDGVHFPYFDFSDPGVADPDTAAVATTFARWVGPRLWPSIIAAGARPGHAA